MLILITHNKFYTAFISFHLEQKCHVCYRGIALMSLVDSQEANNSRTSSVMLNKTDVRFTTTKSATNTTPTTTATSTSSCMSAVSLVGSVQEASSSGQSCDSINKADMRLSSVLGVVTPSTPCAGSGSVVPREMSTEIPQVSQEMPNTVACHDVAMATTTADVQATTTTTTTTVDRTATTAVSRLPPATPHRGGVTVTRASSLRSADRRSNCGAYKRHSTSSVTATMTTSQPYRLLVC